jgi:hypothetical protein
MRKEDERMGWLKAIEIAAGMQGIHGEENEKLMRGVRLEAAVARKKAPAEERDAAAESAGWNRYAEEIRKRKGGKT